MTSPLLPYAVTELFCIAFASTVWFRLNNSMGSEHEVRQLRNMIYAYNAMLFTDILWVCVESGYVVPCHYLNAAINALCILSISFGCYFWFRYIETRLCMPTSKKKIYSWLVVIPLVFITFMDLSSIFTGWIFIIDENNQYSDTDLFFLQGIVNYFYLLVPTVYSVFKAIQTRSKQDRTEYYIYALYMVAPLVSGMLEDFFPTVPLLALNIFLMILIMFLMLQNKQVYNDALTGLNNRRRLNKYLDECLQTATEEKPFILFIMDIDNFKSINDVYGHLEGDKALKMFASVLKEVASKHYAFAARYGGDEFCLVAEYGKRDPEEISSEIQQTLLGIQLEDADTSKRYIMTISIGHTLCDGTNKNADAVLAMADKALYSRKKALHINQN